MKVLYSSWFGPKKTIVDRSSIKMGEISNFLSQKHGFETVFVGDKKSIEMYKNVPFNKVLEFDDRINKVPKCMWSAGKLIALSMMDEPVIHVDFDMFFLNPPSREKLEKDIVCFHSEEYNNRDWLLIYDIFDKENLSPVNTKNIYPISYNSAIIGGQDINCIKSSINELIDHIIFHVDKINLIFNKNDEISRKYLLHSALAAILLEQIWLYQIYKNKSKEIFCFFDGKDIPTIERQSNIEGIIHFWGNKNTKFVKKTIQELHNVYFIR